MTHGVSDDKNATTVHAGGASESVRGAVPQLPAITRFEVRTPTLPPATHTNVYILGRGDLVVVDPASPYPEEQEALRVEIARRTGGGERLAAIFLTHQHVDHVSGAAALRSATGAPIWAHPATAGRLVGRVAVDRVIGEGEAVPAGDLDLETVHTPGHAPGHLCLFDRGSRALVCGDMVASVGTILIDDADDGDMAVYLASLERMRALRPSCLLPAHGPPIWDADELLQRYVAHRMMREGKVRAALDTTPRPLDELVPRAYDDTPQAVWPLAKRSLRAHLVKLLREGVVVEDEGRWRLA